MSDDPDVSAESLIDSERLALRPLERGLEWWRRLRDLGRRDVRLCRGDSFPLDPFSASFTGDSCCPMLFADFPRTLVVCMVMTSGSSSVTFFLLFPPFSAGFSHSTIWPSWVDMLAIVDFAVWTSSSRAATLSDCVTLLAFNFFCASCFFLLDVGDFPPAPTLLFFVVRVVLGEYTMAGAPGLPRGLCDQMA